MDDLPDDGSDRAEPASGAIDDALDTKLCFDVYETNLAFGRFYAPLLEPVGLTYPQYLVLSLLWEREDRSVGDLGRQLDLTSSTLTPLLKRLAAAGLVERLRDARDERRVGVSLTEAGRSLRHRLRDLPGCVEEATGLTGPELRRLQDQLRRIRETLKIYETCGNG